MENFLAGDLAEDDHLHWGQPVVDGLDLIGSSGAAGGGGHNTNAEGCPAGQGGRGGGSIVIAANELALADGARIDASGEGGLPKTYDEGQAHCGGWNGNPQTGGGGGGSGGFVSVISGSTIDPNVVNVAGGAESYQQGWCKSGGGSPGASPPPHNNNFDGNTVPWAGVAFVENSGQKGGSGGAGGFVDRTT
jgi:hypothetical protein